MPKESKWLDITDDRPPAEREPSPFKGFMVRLACPSCAALALVGVRLRIDTVVRCYGCGRSSQTATWPLFPTPQ